MAARFQVSEMYDNLPRKNGIPKTIRSIYEDIPIRFIANDIVFFFLCRYKKELMANDIQYS